MKKKLLFILLLIPFMVNAETINNTVIDEKLDDDVFGSALIVSDSIEVSKNIDGFSLLLGNEINFSGKSEYAIFLGSNVTIEGEVLKEFLAASETVTFKDTFKANRDGFIFANKVILSGNITRNVTIKATEVILENANIANANIEASVIKIKENVKITELSYNEDADITIDDTSEITNKTLLESTNETVSFIDKVGSVLIDYANTLVLFVVLVLIIPKLFERINKLNKEVDTFKVVSYMGYGILSMLLMIIVIPILFMLTIGTYLALLLLAFYIVIALLSLMFTGYLIGYIIWTKLIKKDENYLLIGLVGISVITLLTSLPYVGIYFGLISVLTGIGLVLNLFKKID